MSFLLRCLFWLGLVFSQIAEREGATFASLAQPAAQTLATHAQSLQKQAMDAAVASCRDAPAACLAGARKLAEPRPVDTLRESDRTPDWRLWRLRPSSDGA